MDGFSAVQNTLAGHSTMVKLGGSEPESPLDHQPDDPKRNT